MLRPYQLNFKNDIYAAWRSGFKNVIGVLPTGAGKTITFSDIIKEHDGPSCAVAHRQELVCQISLALARQKILHRIIGPKNIVKLCVAIQMEEIGNSYFSPAASCAVAGVDTLIARRSSLLNYCAGVSLWVMDEAHHVLKANKWGKAVEMFGNARGLGVTATPERSDGKGLGACADGVFNTLITGPDMRYLINSGFLSDYRIFAPGSDIDLSNVNISRTTGDYNPHQLRGAVHKSKIVGDVVNHYKRIAPGRLGVTFVTDIETAENTAANFNAAGVPAAVLSSRSSDRERIATLRKFQNRDILQIINVDLLGEGFDCPGIEVVSMARPTQSYGWYVQAFGRGLRIKEGKTHAIIIDHVGNVERHGLPDAPRVWSLDRRDRRTPRDSEIIPVKVCPSCTAVYERIYKTCPECGYVAAPTARSLPEHVDGDLTELSPEALELMRGAVAAVDMDKEDYREKLAARRVPPIGQLANVKRHVKTQEAQAALRNLIAYWAGYQRHIGRPDSESYKRFYFKFGVDVLTAQALKAADANKLTERIAGELVK